MGTLISMHAIIIAWRTKKQSHIESIPAEQYIFLRDADYERYDELPVVMGFPVEENLLR